MKNTGIAEELMSKMFHPMNVEKWSGWGFDEYIDCL